jgi:N-methylhydantoinase B
VRKGYEVRQDGVRFEVRGGRVAHPPLALDGGEVGTASSTVITRADGATEAVTTGVVVHLQRGDRVDHTVCGSAGAGDPADREPAAQRRDERLGFVVATGATGG